MFGVGGHKAYRLGHLPGQQRQQRQWRNAADQQHAAPAECRDDLPGQQPAGANPAVKPLQLRVTISMRRRAGEYSELRVMQVGIAPRPMPVMKRSRVRDSIDCV